MNPDQLAEIYDHDTLRRAADLRERIERDRSWRAYTADIERVLVATAAARGLSHVVVRCDGDGRPTYAAGRDAEGLPWVVPVLAWVSPARTPTEVGPGPALEARVLGGRVWRLVTEYRPHQQIRDWRVAQEVPCTP